MIHFLNTTKSRPNVSGAFSCAVNDMQTLLYFFVYKVYGNNASVTFKQLVSQGLAGSDQIWLTAVAIKNTPDSSESEISLNLVRP